MKKLFYAFSLAIGLVVAGSLNSVAQSGKPLFPEMPGLVSYTYRHSFAKDVSATLDTIQRLGFRDMEFSNLFGQTPEKLRQLLDQHNIKCSSYGVSYDNLMRAPLEIARQAKVLGASYVRIAGVPHEKGNFTLDDANRTIQDFNKIGKTLKEQGLTFVYHNHGFEFRPYKNGTFFDYIVQNTDPATVSYELDILWAVHPGDDPVRLLNKYGNRFKLMHLKDLKKGVQGDYSGGTPVENDVALGTGQINLPAVLKAAKKAGVKHYYIEDESPNIQTQVPQSIAYLKSLKQ
ncbi:sugar phosphate isomerase/epimerase family protein [Adhaeribacter aquaticus]|uniref:sugar phosphate isomerase/epimerase family protein n=1 Tax=Adhaeribacter aquaticus TaxID=299567 RepID=UPI00041CE615|nr:sugar phosphate isomerase/epimerase [Adhaeribacter aquaticus]